MAKMRANNASAVRTSMRGVRLTHAKCAMVEKTAIERAFSSASAFIRAAIDHELDGVGREAKLNEAENRIAASLERLSIAKKASADVQLSSVDSLMAEVCGQRLVVVLARCGLSST